MITSFTAASSWSAFDTAVLKLDSEPRFTACFRWPLCLPGSSFDGLLVRNDPEAPSVTSYRGRCRTCPRSPTILCFRVCRCGVRWSLSLFRPTGLNLLRFDARDRDDATAIHGAHSTEMVGPAARRQLLLPPSSSGVPAPVTIAGVSLADDGRICESTKALVGQLPQALVTVEPARHREPGRSVSLGGYRSSCRNSKTSPGQLRRTRRTHLRCVCALARGSSATLALDDHHLDRRRPPRAPARIQRRRLPTDRAHAASRGNYRGQHLGDRVFQKA